MMIMILGRWILYLYFQLYNGLDVLLLQFISRSDICIAVVLSFASQTLRLCGVFCMGGGSVGEPRSQFRPQGVTHDTRRLHHLRQRMPRMAVPWAVPMNAGLRNARHHQIVAILGMGHGSDRRDTAKFLGMTQIPNSGRGLFHQMGRNKANKAGHLEGLLKNRSCIGLAYRKP